jgi:hypothetical protein
MTMGGNAIQANTVNPLATSSRPDLLDDILFTLGTSLDVNMHLNSAGFGANTTTGTNSALIGTVVGQAVAANSFVGSNKTASGDWALYANLGGHSQQFLLYKTATSTLHLMGSISLVGATTISSTGIITINPVTNLIETGVAAATGAGNVGTLPAVLYRLNYRDGANASQNWDASDTCVMNLGGAAPKLTRTLAINSVTAFAMENNNGVITNYLKGIVIQGAVTASYGRISQGFEANGIATNGGMAINTWLDSTEPGVFDFNKARSATPGTYTAITSGDKLGSITFRGADGTDFQDSAYIVGVSLGTIGNNRVPGSIQFHCYSDASTSIDTTVLTLNATTATWSNVTHTSFVASGDITLNDVKVENLKAGTTAINPESAHRGQFYAVEGGAGVADKLYCIMKGTADTYSAVLVATAL